MPDNELTQALKKWKLERQALNEKLKESMYSDVVIDLKSDAMRKIILRLTVLEQDLLQLAQLKYMKLQGGLDDSFATGNNSNNSSMLKRVSPSFASKKLNLKKKSLFANEESSNSKRDYASKSNYNSSRANNEDDKQSQFSRNKKEMQPAKLAEPVKPSNTPYLVKTDFRSGKKTHDENGNLIASPSMGGAGKKLPAKNKFMK